MPSCIYAKEGIFMFDFFIKTIVDEYGDTTYLPTTAGYVALIVIVAAILVIAVALSNKKKKTVDTKQLVFCAVAMGLATVTSFMKVYSFPFGGSITLLSMFFICLPGYWYGLKTGLMTAVAYGILQLIVDPYVLYPAQLIVDYICAFGALGLSGLFCQKKNGLIKGYILGVCGRYVFAVISGWIFFGMYAWEGWDPLPYSLAYNACYIFGEAAITLVLIAIPAVSKGLLQVKKVALE